jgi:putative tryptophan/tyrosine transport system substrate-binding protein
MTEISDQRSEVRNQRAKTSRRGTGRLLCALSFSAVKSIAELRLLISGLFALLFAFCLPVQAQQPTKIPRVGFLASGLRSASTQRVELFQQGLSELGYVDGKNIVIEYRYAGGKLEPVAALAAELVRLKVDVIVTDTSVAIDAVKNVTKTIPVVFTLGIDPVQDGQVTSLAKPGGNLTGFSILAPELNGKRLDLLKEAFPKITRVGRITRGGTARGEQRIKDDEVVAKGLGLRLQSILVKGADDLEGAFEGAKRAGVHALIFPPSVFLATNRTRFIYLTAKIRLPAIYPSTPYAEAGGLMSYGPDQLDNFRRAATYVDKILKGANPADLPVEQPMKFEFAINLKTTKQIGVTIPPNVLARADKVIK